LIRLLVAVALIWAVLQIAPPARLALRTALTSPQVPAQLVADLPLRRVTAVHQAYDSVVKVFFAMATFSGLVVGLILGIGLMGLASAVLDALRSSLRSCTDSLARIAHRIAPLPPGRPR
jgi:hypothetical protein